MDTKLVIKQILRGTLFIEILLGFAACASSRSRHLPGPPQHSPSYPHGNQPTVFVNGWEIPIYKDGRFRHALKRARADEGVVYLGVFRWRDDYYTLNGRRIVDINLFLIEKTR